MKTKLFAVVFGLAIFMFMGAFIGAFKYLLSTNVPETVLIIAKSILGKETNNDAILGLIAAGFSASAMCGFLYLMEVLEYM